MNRAKIFLVIFFYVHYVALFYVLKCAIIDKAIIIDEVNLWVTAGAKQLGKIVSRE